jgi:hypothetical protein
MQAAAFLALQRARDDQVGGEHQVAQFDQVIADAEIAVELVDFALKHADAMLGALQALGGAHDADIVPHRLTQLGPVVRDHHFLVGIGDLAFVPRWQLRQRRSGLGKDVFRRRFAIHQTFEQRIARQPVGTVQAGVGRFADHIQSGHISAGIEISDHPAAGVVRGRHHRNRLMGDVDAQFEAVGVNGREVQPQPLGRLVADVEIDAVQPAFLHLEVDRSRHHVARRQFGTRVVFGHEAGAVGQLEQATFAAHRFGDQEGFGLRVIEAGRMELDEFHVRHPAARAPGHGHAIAGGDIGIGGEQIDLARTAGGEHGVARGKAQHAVALDVEHVSAQTALVVLADAIGADQVDRDVVFEDVDVRMRAHQRRQRGLHCSTGGVGGVNDASVRVAAFAGEVIAVAR